MKVCNSVIQGVLLAAAAVPIGATDVNRSLRKAARSLTNGNVVEVLTAGVSGISFSRLVQYIDASRLNYTNPADSLTFFAPDDEALADLETQIQFDPSDPANYFLTGGLLRYLVLTTARLAESFADGEVDQDRRGNLTFTQNPFFLNGAPIKQADIEASNGVIHAVNPLVLPEDFFLFTTVVDFLSTDEDYSTLVSLLVQTGLDEVLKSGLYTVFAPDNSAFEDLGQENIDFLTAPENEEALKQVLLYHVVPSLACSCDIIAAQGVLDLTIVQGEEVAVRGTLFVTIEDQFLNIFNFDNFAGNGIVHGMFGVLLPSAVDNIIVRPTDSPTTAPSASPTTAPVFDVPLDDVGNNGLPMSAFPLAKCQGDCDSDDDGIGEMQCFTSEDSDSVPGCSGTRSKTKRGRMIDYCYQPDMTVDPPLNEVGNNGKPDDAFPLGMCEGDCDSDDDCDGEMKCFDSNSEDSVPGCSGTRRRNQGGNLVDFCYQP